MRNGDLQKPPRQVVENFSVLALSAASLTLLPWQGVLANNSSTAESTDGPRLIEEIMVTAQKRSQSLQDVPVAVTALTADAVDQARITQVDHLVHMVPALGLQKGYTNRSSAFSIRGIGTQAFSSAVEPSVSMVVDGIVMGRSAQAFSELPDVERIEVLRGPQGTLFGKNASAGLIHIITKPVTEAPEGELSVSAATEDTYRLATTFSSPVTDSLGYRVTLYSKDQAGYIENLFENSEQLNAVDDSGGRLKLRWASRDDLSLEWRSDYADQESNCCAPVLSRIESSLFENNAAPIQASRDNLRSNANGLHIANSLSWGHAFDAVWETENHSLTSISAYREYKIVEGQDIDFLPIDVIHKSLGKSQQRQVSQEIRWATSSPGTIDVIAGLYYFEQVVLREYTRGALADVEATLDARISTRNYAGFFDVDFALTDRTNLSVGARYTRETLRYRASRGAFAFQGLEAIDGLSDSTGDAQWSGKLSLEWRHSQTTLWYASWTQGYKGKAFNVQFDLEPETAQALNPETGNAWELGSKSTLFNKLLTLNVAAYYMDYEDLQVQVQDPGSLQFSLVNAGEVSTRGLEMDLIAYPTAQLQIVAGASWMDAKIDDLLGALCSSGQLFRGECAEGVLDLSGEPLPFAPRVKFTISALYSIDLPALPYRFATGLLYRRQSKIELALDNDIYKEQSSYGLVDMHATLAHIDESYELELFVKNVGDKKYATTILDSPLDPNGYVQFLTPDFERSVGLELKFRW